MKPNDAEELSTPSDLTGVSVLYAKDSIQKELSPKYDKKLYWELRVSSQEMGEAIKLAYLIGLNVNVDFTYDVDEWSLGGTRYDHDGFKAKTIWSPGA